MSDEINKAKAAGGVPAIIASVRAVSDEMGLVRGARTSPISSETALTLAMMAGTPPAAFALFISSDINFVLRKFCIDRSGVRCL